jgi:hypothetical protein
VARTSKVDACLICDCTPCECNAKPSKQAKQPAKKAAPKVTASITEAMKARVKNPEPVSVSPVKVEHDEPIVITDEDQFRAALLALAPILHHDELVKYRMIVANPDRRLLSERAADWRERNALQDSA